MGNIKHHKQSNGYHDDICCGHGGSWIKKETLICPICGYTARKAFEDFGYQFDKYNSSIHCPTCKIELQSLGCKTRIPKKGSNKFKKFIK